MRLYSSTSGNRTTTTLANNYAFVLVYPHNIVRTRKRYQVVMQRQSIGKEHTVFLKTRSPFLPLPQQCPVPEILLLADIGWVFGDGPLIGGMRL
jgi:hypothetical protein